RAKLAHGNDRVSAYHVRHQSANLLKISNVIAQYLSVGFRELGGAHANVALVKLAGVKKFASRRSRQFKSFRWVNLVQLLQDRVAVWPLRLIENVKTAEPRCERETGQKQNCNRPGKIIDSPPGRTRIRLVLVRIVRMCAIVHQFSAR